MAFMKRSTSVPAGATSRVMATLGLLCSVLMLRCGVLHAVDIDGYNSNTACSGAGKSCLNIAPRTCCRFSGLLPRAVRIGYLGICQFGVIYNGNTQSSCRTSLASQAGQGRKCFLRHGSVWGADWYALLPSATCRSSAQADELSDGEVKVTNHSMPTCTSTVMPNAVIYSSDSSQGKWILESHGDAHDGLLSQLETMDEKNKEEWLQSQGAYYVKDEAIN